MDLTVLPSIVFFAERKEGNEHPVLRIPLCKRGIAPAVGEVHRGGGEGGKKEINHDPEQREKSRENYGVNVSLCLRLAVIFDILELCAFNITAC